MNWIRNLNINQRLVLFSGSFTFLVFLALGVAIYLIQNRHIKTDMNARMEALTIELESILEIQNAGRQKNITSAVNLSHHILSQANLYKSDSLSVAMNAINQETRQAHKATLTAWLIDTTQVQYSTEFVDFVKTNTNATATIFQKIPQGYIRISTNVKNKDGSRATGTYIPNTSPVVQAIERGERYTGKAFVVNDWYLTAYEPLYINGEIQGMFYVGVEAIDYAPLKSIFEKLSYGNTRPFLLDHNGKAIIHPLREGEDLSNTLFFTQMKKAHSLGKKKIRYRWPENQNGQWHWAYFSYFEPLDVYICASVLEKDLYKVAQAVGKVIIFGMLISILVLLLGMYLIMKPVIGSIRNLDGIIAQMAKGHSVEKIGYRRNDEIGNIVNSLNVLIKGLSDTAKFANKIEQEQFETRFTPLSQDDTLGNALLDMRNSLKKAKEEQQKRNREDKIRNWENRGVAKFAEILRQNNDNLQKLARSIVVNLTKYLNAELGGMYLINTDDRNDPYIELVATFAFERKRKINKRIELEEGLIGRCIEEKKKIYMTDLPNSYIKITSGLGKENPKTLLITPLIFNQEIFGAIEIATFNHFEPYHIEFVEKISESIASTIASAKINIRTARLLEESQQQAEEMAAQEEEMRQNLEELQTTQEEAARREQLLHQKMEEIEKARAEFAEKERQKSEEIDMLREEINVLQEELNNAQKTE